MDNKEEKIALETQRLIQIQLGELIVSLANARATISSLREEVEHLKSLTSNS